MARTKVQSELIATNAISGTIIADGAITSTHLAANCVDSSELVTGSIDTIHIAANQVTATKIVTNGVLTRHISDDQVTAAKLANSINTDIATGVTANTTANAALPKAGGTMTGSLLIDSSSSASIGLDRGNDTSGSTIDFKTGGTLKWYMGLRGLSNDNFYLRNEAGSTDALTILTSGNVGIGETNPDASLHITSNTPIISFDESDASQEYRIGSFGGSFALYDSTDSAYRLVVDGSGKVGIGETSPIALLHINGAGDAVRVTSTNTGAGGAQMDLLHYTSSPADNDIHGSINFGGYYSGSSSAYGSSIRSVWSDVSAREGQLQFFTRDDADFAARMVIDKDGNVGIGETTPDDTLHVNASGGVARLRIGSGNDAYYTNKGYLGDTWYFGSGETGDVVTSTISGGAFTSSNAGGAFVWKTDNSGTLSEKMRIRSDGIVTTPKQCYFLAVRTSNLNPYNFTQTSGATTPIFTSIVSAQSSASGTAAFSTTDGTFSAPVDGLYLFHVSFYSNITIEQAWITQNGARISYTDMVANSSGSYTSGTFSSSIQYYMTAGQSIRIHPYSASGNNDYIYDNVYHTYWKGVLLG